MSTTNKPSQKAIEVKNEELENYFANTIIPQLFIDSNFILRKFTPPAMEHFNLSEADVGKNFDEVKDNIKYLTVIENIQEVIDTGEIFEKEVQTTDGRWYQMNILPYKVQKENRTNGVILTFVEITQRIQVRSDLEKLNAAHETLMFALSHDIKQPLTTLSLLGPMLKVTFEQQDRKAFLKSLERFGASIQDIRSLLDGFVDMSSAEADWEKKREQIDIESVVENVTTGLRTAQFTTANFETDFQTSEIMFSRNNLRSIVYNLLNNAIKYRKPDHQLCVKISTRKVDGYVLLQVQDNGMGIDKEQREKIFEKGTRLHSNLEGTGMGLYIIRRMLESMNGKIEVESTPREGSCFSVYFSDKPH